MINNTQTFKQFLEEGRGKATSVEDFMKWADANCSAYLKGDKHLYRGFRDGAGPLLIGSSVGEKPRKSVGGIPNNYTLWIDGHPKFKGFPKRSASFIASTNMYKAGDFGSEYLMLCPDDVKIAQVLAKDIWVKHILPNKDEPVILASLNDATEYLLRKFQLNDNDKYFQFQNALQHLSLKRMRSLFDAGQINQNVGDIKNIIEKMEKEGWRDMYQFWDSLVTPEIFKISDGADLNADLEGEVWVEGTCGFISLGIPRLTDEEKTVVGDWLKDKSETLYTFVSEQWHKNALK